MMNVMQLRNYAAIIVPQLMTTVAFFVMLVMYNMTFAIITLLLMLIVGTVVGRALSRNAFTQLLEGKGILTLDISSTGIIRPFIVGLQAGKPYFSGIFNKTAIRGIFNREAVTQMNAPVEAGNHASITNDKSGQTKLNINIDIDKYNASKFQLFSFPTIIYNSQIGSIITKDFLSDQEKNVFAEHTLLYANQKLDDLTTNVRDFSRGVVESLKPKFNPMGSWVVWAVIIFMLVLLVIFFGPAVIETLTQTGGIASQGVSTTSAIVPR